MATKKNKEKKVTEKVQNVQISVKWNIPENMITRFASNIVVQTIEDVFKVSFFEMMPDIKFGLEQKIPDEVQANCVASLIITPEKLRIFTELLQKQLSIYENLKSKSVLPSSSSES